MISTHADVISAETMLSISEYSLPVVYKPESVQIILYSDEFSQTEITFVFRQQQLTLQTHMEYFNNAILLKGVIFYE